MTTSIQEFIDSTPVLDDPEALRERLGQDGYLFFRELIDSDEVLKVRSDILSQLASLGWLAEDSDPEDARPGPVISREGDERWWPMYARLQSQFSFHALAHHDNIKRALAPLIEGDILVHPRSIGRVTYPSSEHPTPPHQDYHLIQGSADVFTLWVPFGEVPVSFGGLRILRRSFATGQRTVVPAQGVGGVGVEVELDDPNWRTTDYRPGDVLAFHSFTVHYAPPNRGDRLRLSADYRYQSVNEPIVTGSLHPHGYPAIPDWDELTKDWPSDWPVRVPEGLNVTDVQNPFEVRAPQSRFVPA